jgi:hypothetical protein
MSARETINRLAGLHDRIAADVPQIRRGMVWCTTCGRSERVNGADCCGFTMTIDSPEERRSLSDKEQGR